jgi:hypothetical protein
MYFAECPGVALGKAVEINLCREPLGGTRQRRRLCRVPPIWHSANHILKIKKSLPSAASRALGKEHQLSQTDGFSFFSLSLTLTRSRHRPRARARPRRRPRAAPGPAHARPRSPRAARAHCVLAAPPTTADDPAPALAAGHARAPALHALARPPRPPRRRALHALASPPSRPPRRHDLHAVTTSTPSRPFAVVHRPRRANRYKLIFKF